jgi:hypothetical protein
MKPWLWPDHAIGKRESRRLREEHNAAVNESRVNCGALLESVRQELVDMGFGTDRAVNGGDAVEYLGKLLPDIEEALTRDFVTLPK